MVRSYMSFQAKRELLDICASRYREATTSEKTVILNEFVASTGYARKYAIRLLTHPPQCAVQTIRRPRAHHYGVDVQQALTTAWMASNCICAKRLVPFLPELVPVLERHGHLTLSQGTRASLLSLSAATADRLLRPLRSDTPRGRSTTKPGRLLKHQVPVRTFADWNEMQPGFLEADLVAHCGSSVEGSYLQTLVLTDIATAWTECLPLLQHSQEAVIQALTQARKLLPFAMLGLDTDNGSEFLNLHLIEYCRREQITFTRSRAYKKNDQCYVEQKNGAVVRQLVGYGRYEGVAAYRQLQELYRAVRLYVNFFQPSMKLIAKHRQGAKARRHYDLAQTPYQRLMASGVLVPAAQERLASFYQVLDPVRLLGHMESLQDAFWRQAIREGSLAALLADQEATTNGPATNGPATLAVALKGQQTSQQKGQSNGYHNNDDHKRDQPKSVILVPPLTSLSPVAIETRRKRHYRRSDKPRVPHTWRTCPDPFEAVWKEVCQWLSEAPERTAKSLLEELQQRYPEQYPDAQLRTLQRRVKAWRRQMIVAFDDGWLSEELPVAMMLPGVLHGTFEVEVEVEVEVEAGLYQNQNEQNRTMTPSPPCLSENGTAVKIIPEATPGQGKILS
jgi:hypothetical protein